MPFAPTQIIVHHDSVSREGPSFAIVNAFHKQKGFPESRLGFFVGYHFWIERDGTLRQARQENEVGAHCKGQNYSAFGIGLAGNFDAEDPTPAQIATLGELLSRLCNKYRIPAQRIFPHRRYAEKSCYGSRLKDNWAALVFLKFELARIQAMIREQNPSLWAAAFPSLA